MARFDFEGDLTSARKPHLEFLSEILQQKGFKGSKVLVESVGDVGDNFIANVKRIVVNEHGEKLIMIAKLGSGNTMMRENSILGTAFKIEAFAYTDIFPKFEEIFNAASVSNSEKIKFPKCYGVSLEVPNEVILLEDLKESGFGTLSKQDSITEHTLNLLIKFLAIYHSLSFVVRYQEPHTFLRFQNKLKSLIEADTKGMEKLMKFFDPIGKQAVQLVDDDRNKRLTHNVMSNLSSINMDIRKINMDSKYTVIQHGDLWIPNFMFKLENGFPTECILVDYQMINMNSPASDLMLMIFNNTTHKQRSPNFHKYVDYYNQELDKSLKNFGLSGDVVYPRDKLDADMKSHAKFVFACNIISSSLSTKSKDEAKVMKRNMEQTESIDQQKIGAIMKRDEMSAGRFKARIEDLLASYSQLGLVEMLS